jgi:hypothetical protein
METGLCSLGVGVPTECSHCLSSQLALCTSRVTTCAVIGTGAITRVHVGRPSGAGVPELHCAVTHGRFALYMYLQLSAAARQHAYSLSWQSLVGPDAPMCLLDFEFFHTPESEGLRQARHHVFTTPERRMLVHSLEKEANSVGDLLSCLLQARRSHPTDQSNTQIHSLSRLAGGDFRSSGR